MVDASQAYFFKDIRIELRNMYVQSWWDLDACTFVHQPQPTHTHAHTGTPTMAVWLSLVNTTSSQVQTHPETYLSSTGWCHTFLTKYITYWPEGNKSVSPGAVTNCSFYLSGCEVFVTSFFAFYVSIKPRFVGLTSKIYFVALSRTLTDLTALTALN